MQQQMLVADGPMQPLLHLSSSASSRLPPPLPSTAAASVTRCTATSSAPPLCVSSSTLPKGMEMTKHGVREKGEIVRHLETWAKEQILPLLKPVGSMWQPQDFLPEAAEEGFMEEVVELRARAAALPDEYLVCLVGDAITEEALPTYQTMLYSFVGPPSPHTPAESAWATWVRGWTAEENRHGDLLRQYLYLTGKVDMRMMERTTHYLIASGMDVGLENNPYYGFIYTSFQERATAISHGNTGRKAAEAGDEKLAKICGVIAGDEKRHERAYSKVVEKLLEVDPEGTMLALEVMMRRKIVMPAHLMFDGQEERLFHHFSRVAQRVGVYTAADYANILSHFVQRWKLESLRLSSSSAIAAQDYVCSLPARFRKLEERSRSRSLPPGTAPFSWIFNRHVLL